ncbi:MAG: hypothetical protein HYV65_03390, partial [Candidatus Spechtbacteria bacterium]|nr:hypothetical protein [Candidatus Spechtbacteria bacterium]
VMTNVTGIPVSALANGTDGELITWDASGVATTVAAGTAAQVLTSNGAGAAPTFQAAAGGGTTILHRVSAAQAATTCATTDTNLTGGTYTIPANLLSTNKGIRWTALVSTVAIGTADQINFLIDIAGTNIVTNSHSLAFGNSVTEVSGLLYNRDSTSSQIAYNNLSFTGDASGSRIAYGTAGVDSTADISFSIQCIDVNPGSGGDDDQFTLQMLIIEQVGTE